jgi:cell division protein FtsW
MKAATTILFVSVLGLLALGMVTLFSASTAQPQAKYYMMQPVWGGIGLAMFAAAAMVDYRRLKKHPALPWVLFALAVLLLLAVWKFGHPRKGATRWLTIAGFSLQPSEFAKIALIVLLAWWGDRFQKRFAKPASNLAWGLLLPGLCVAPLLVLIFREPDWGTTFLLAAVSGVLLFLAGTRWYFLFIPAVAGAYAVYVMIVNDPVRGDRWDAYTHPEKHREGVGYQTHQAMVALGSGGVTGLGLGNGSQKLGFVPEHHTDFIFSVIGEELGLIATTLVLVAYVAIVLSGVYIAWHASDIFGMLLASGVTCLIGVQAAINIGVVTGALPNKGIALPFVSYGGSNLVLMLGCVGLLWSVARHATEERLLFMDNPFAGPDTLAPQPS